MRVRVRLWVRGAGRFRWALLQEARKDVPDEGVGRGKGEVHMPELELADVIRIIRPALDGVESEDGAGEVS